LNHSQRKRDHRRNPKINGDALDLEMKQKENTPQSLTPFRLSGLRNQWQMMKRYKILRKAKRRRGPRQSDQDRPPIKRKQPHLF